MSTKFNTRKSTKLSTIRSTIMSTEFQENAVLLVLVVVLLCLWLLLLGRATFEGMGVIAGFLVWYLGFSRLRVECLGSKAFKVFGS